MFNTTAGRMVSHLYSPNSTATYVFHRVDLALDAFARITQSHPGVLLALTSQGDGTFLLTGTHVSL